MLSEIAIPDSAHRAFTSFVDLIRETCLFLCNYMDYM